MKHFLSINTAVFPMFRELRKVAYTDKTDAVRRPGRPELLQLAYHNSLPFVGQFWKEARGLKFRRG
jgi:hypothetical protein